MITTLSAMRMSVAACAGDARAIIRAAIIGVLLAALALASGCSALRLTYGAGPQLAWWWIDGYFDFDSEQAPKVKAGLTRWFEWHRASQLSSYITLLGELQVQAGEPMSAAQACRWNARIREALEPAIDRALVEAAELLPLLGEAQLRHLEQRYARNLEEMRDEYLQPDPVARRDASVKRAIERSEQIYGKLGDAQRKVIADGVAVSPFDPLAWRDERVRRQRDTAATLRRLVVDKADRDTRIAALRTLAERAERSPDPGYREYQRRLVDYNCDFASRIHNATTPEQRLKARENLKGYEDDLRSLIAPAGNGTVPGGAPPGAPG
jgi:hypothetical protein